MEIDPEEATLTYIGSRRLTYWRTHFDLYVKVKGDSNKIDVPPSTD